MLKSSKDKSFCQTVSVPPAGSSLVYVYNSVDSATEPCILLRFYCSWSRSEEVLDLQTILNFPPVDKKLLSRQSSEVCGNGWKRYYT